MQVLVTNYFKRSEEVGKDRVCISLLSHDLCRRIGVVLSDFWGKDAHAHFCARVWKPEVSA